MAPNVEMSSWIVVIICVVVVVVYSTCNGDRLQGLPNIILGFALVLPQLENKFALVLTDIYIGTQPTGK